MYVTGWRQITKVKVDRWLSFIFFAEKIICKETIQVFFMFICTALMYEYMRSFRKDVNNLFDNTCVRIKLYWEFYDGTIYIANERRHVRIWFNFLFVRIQNKINNVLIFKVWFMVLNATFNNISVISWRPIYWWRKPENRKKPLTCRKSLTNFIT